MVFFVSPRIMEYLAILENETIPTDVDTGQAKMKMEDLHNKEKRKPSSLKRLKICSEIIAYKASGS